MRDIEVRLITSDSQNWNMEVYDPNVQHLVSEGKKKFSGVGEAEVWFEAYGTITHNLTADEGFKVLRGTVPSDSLESLLSD
jgi:hypothetical protein